MELFQVTNPIDTTEELFIAQDMEVDDGIGHNRYRIHRKSVMVFWRILRPNNVLLEANFS